MEMYKPYGVSLDGCLHLNTWLRRLPKNIPTSPLIKGTIVPDLQTELKKLETLAFDDEGSTTEINMTLPHAFKTSNNVSRETFNYIKDNPGLRRVQIAHAMEDRGFKKSSAMALSSQFVRAGMARVVDGGVFVAQSEYTPIKSLPKKAKGVSKVTAKKIQKAIMEAPVQPIVSHDTLVKAMLSRMSIIQAREMYDELKKIFAS
jgi:butyrate kinase